MSVIFYRGFTRLLALVPPSVRVFVMLGVVLLYGTLGFVQFERTGRPELGYADAALWSIVTVSSSAVLAPTVQAISHDLVTWKQSPAEPAGFAHDLYASLRELDALGCVRILVQQPPAGEAWLAVNDRLRRAAAGSGEDDET